MLKNQSAQRIIGLISGTSVDGVDAALIEVRDDGSSIRVQVLAHDTYPYPEHLQTQLLAAAYPDSSSVFRSDGLLAASCEMSTQQSLEK